MLLTALLLACQDAGVPPVYHAAAAPAPDTATPAESYTGPDFQPCISQAQCEPGSACTPVTGHATAYCAPPCDPAGDGSECLPEGADFSAICLSTGRCAMDCPEEDIAQEDEESGELIPAATDTCPESLACMESEAAALPVCAGPRAGGAGFYGICTHPNVEGSDCPESSSCFGGSYLGLDEVGVCLPWCDDGSCPAVPEGVTASPLCYDVGLDHPVCALLCSVSDGICPEDQYCYDFGFTGLCVPDGSVLDY